MKPAVIAGRAAPAQKAVRAAPVSESLREHVALCDLTDCLLSAYDGVARLAYEKFRVRGKDSAGNELEDWLDAESELAGPDGSGRGGIRRFRECIGVRTR